MEESRVREILSACGAVITDSHIVYTSWKHGTDYVDKAAVYPFPLETDELCGGIAELFLNDNVQVVVAPAVGGIILGQGVAYHLSTGQKTVNSIFAEKVDEGGIETLAIKRTYGKYVPGKRVLIVDDVLTTGGSVKKLVDLVKAAGGIVVGVGVLCNRGNVQPEDIGNVPKLEALISVQMASYDEVDCPQCAKGVPINTELGRGKEYLAQKNR